MPEYFFFLGSDDPKAPGALLLWSETMRIMFNCPEGTQRFFNEIQERLVAVSQVFFTRTSSHHTMGFPGQLFTINDSGVKNISVTAPSSTEMGRWWKTMYSTFYTHGRTLTLNLREPTEEFTAPTFSVYPVPCTTTQSRGGGSDDDDDHDSSSSSTITPSVLSYLCVGTVIPKFDPQEAARLGVKPGKKYGLLRAGQKVESDITPGVFISPEQVLRMPGSSLPSSSSSSSRASASTSGDNKKKRTAVDAEDDIGDTSCRAVLVADYPDAASFPNLRALEATAGGGCKIHTVLHVASYPLPFEFHRALSSGGSESSVSDIEFGPTCCSFVDRDRRVHIIAPTCLPPDMHTTAFPTSSVMRMHLRLMAPLLFPTAPQQASSSTSSSSSSSSSAGSVLWPYSQSCGVRLRLLASSFQQQQQSSDGNSSSDRRKPPSSDTIFLPDKNQATGMLSPALLAKVNQEEAAAAGTVSDDGDAAVVLEGSSSNNNNQKNVDWIRFGGTGSAVPTKYRNVSSIALSLDGGNSTVLFDCGEGTSGQLLVALGRDGLQKFLCSLKLIFISHMHADHHFGLFVLLSLRREYLLSSSHRKGRVGGAANADDASTLPQPPPPPLPPLPIIAPREVCVYFKELLFRNPEQLPTPNNNATSSSSQQTASFAEMHATEFSHSVGQLGKDFVFLESEDVASSQPEQKQSPHSNSQHLAAFLQLSQLLRISIFKVEHPGSAHGIRLDLPAATKFPRSVVYTGDTRPCASSVAAARGADLLIHEATFDSSMGSEALAKMHSTVDEAISVAKEAGVRYLMLNHFSQRYPKLTRHQDQNQQKEEQRRIGGVDDSSGDKSNNNNNGDDDNQQASSSPAVGSSPLRIGASCDLLCLSAGDVSYDVLCKSLPLFTALLDEYEQWGNSESLSKKLRRQSV